jgi:hypothetical protein
MFLADPVKLDAPFRPFYHFGLPRPRTLAASITAVARP